MRKGLILGFVGNNPKHARRLPDDAVGQLIRGNVPLGYRTVLTGIEGNFEMGCAAAALRLRGEGLKIKLHIAVTRGKYKTYLRYKRDNLRPSEAHRIIEQADNVEIIEGKTPLEAERLRDRHVVDKSDLLFYYSTQLRDDFRNKYISYYLERQHPRKNVCDLSDKSGRAFGAMFNQRTNPAYRKMKRLVESGELGEIRRTNVVITDWLRAQSYYDSCAWRATWAEDGGGVLLNQAPHNLDLWQWICGMPLRVRAFCGFGRWHDIEVEDDVTAYVEYPNGATGTFITCTGEAPGTNRFEISMTGGQLVYENNRLTLARPDTPVDRFIREYAGGFGKPNVAMEDITPDEPYPMHAGVIRAFADHILTGAPMIADGREGLCSLMLANAMLLSSWTDETIELPLDDARYADRLAALAAQSPKKTAKPIKLDVSKSF